ncbi:MAG: hypothetical protein CMK92_05975 [Pseudomonas sp.]|nr:hypothetical protein [Pseudomonas sp.]|tara:strand:+ start:1068 stop:2066 length:999 start_codon:yes stop_codon:yes gene_type:complete
MYSEKVTICIPLYNCENTIAKTLDSLVNQSYENIKIKVFDNQSTDKSAEIVKKFVEKYTHVEYFYNEVNLGAEGNFTRCIQEAEGDFTAIFHSDDIYYQSMVEEQIRVLINDSKIGAVACHAQEINENDEVVGERYIPSILKKEDLYVFEPNELRSFVCKYANFITCPSVMIRSSFLKNEIKIWNGDEYKSSADLDVWLRINKIFRFAFLNKPLMGYRLAQESFSYRIAKLRTYKHDLFLVLDTIENKTLNEVEDSYFLEFKDITLRIVNIIRSKKLDEELPVFDYNWQILFKKAFFSLWHMKFFIIGFIVYMMRPLLSKKVRSIYWKKIER